MLQDGLAKDMKSVEWTLEKNTDSKELLKQKKLKVLY